MNIPQAKPSEFLRIAGTYFHCGPELPLDFRGSRAFSIEGWIGFPRRSLSSRVIFSKAGELTLGLTSRGQLFVEHQPWQGPLVGRTVLKPGVWNHVGVTSNGTSLELFVNGIRDVRSFGYPVVFDPSPRPEGSSEASPFEGEVWNLRCWSVARTAPEMFRATWASLDDSHGLAANFFPELPSPERCKLGRTDNPPRMPLAA